MGSTLSSVFDPLLYDYVPFDDAFCRALKEDARAMQRLEISMRHNKKAMIESMTIEPQALAYIADELKADRDVVLEAVKKDYTALYHASPKLKGDRQFITDAVSCCGLAVQYGDPEFLRDRDIIGRAVRRNADALEYADASLKNNRDFLLKIMNENGQALQYVPRQWQDDPEFKAAATQALLANENYISYDQVLESAFGPFFVPMDCTRAVEVLAPWLRLEAEIIIKMGNDNLQMHLPPAKFKLTEDEQLAFVIYTQNGFYHDLNGKLRDARKTPAAAALPPPFASYICHLYRGIRKMPPVRPRTTVYRGVPYQDPAVVKENYALGRPVFWSAVTSTSLNRGVACGFASRGPGPGIIYEITLAEGFCIAECSAFPQEEEVLLLPNTKLIVTSEEPKKDAVGFWVVKLGSVGKPFVF